MQSTDIMYTKNSSPLDWASGTEKYREEEQHG